MPLTMARTSRRCPPLRAFSIAVTLLVFLSERALALTPIGTSSLQCQPRAAFSAKTQRQIQSLVVLNAKKKSKTKKSVAPAKQGFGARAPSKKNSGKRSAEDDDFRAFPRLEPQVMETLIEAPPVLFHDPGELPDQVYDHLGQVYGFKNFNGRLQGEGEAESTSESMSFEDLLTATSSDTSSGSASTAKTSSSSASDFSDLIALATGGEPTSSSSSSSTQILEEEEGVNQDLSQYLNQLPPFTEFRVLHFDPLILAIDDFFTEEECERYIEMSSGGSSDSILKSRSPTVGKDKHSRSQRTSTTWYHFYKGVPELMAKAAKLVGIDSIQQWEEPQTVRYRRTEKFTWHLDALGPDERRSTMGGQRIATLLVYLSDLSEQDGGATMFRDLKTPEGERLAVAPKKGSALLFFPAAGGIPDTPFDIRTLHCGQAVSQEAENDKWIAQLWLCEKDYTPTAPSSKNLHSNAFDGIAEYCEKTTA